MFDPYHKWLAIPPKEQPPNHYRLLGVDLFEKDLDVIESAADKQMAFVRQYQSGENATEAANVLNELANARLCLLKPDKKAEYDAKLRKKTAASAAPAKPDPEAAFAAMPLPEVPSTSIVVLPKRKRRSKKSGGLPPNVIWIAVAVAVVIVIFPFIPKGSTNLPSDLASVTEPSATIESPPQTAAVGNDTVGKDPVGKDPAGKVPAGKDVARIDASASPKSPNPDLEKDSAAPIVAALESNEKQGAAGQPMKETESTTDNRPAVVRPKSTKSTVDPGEAISVENELVGGTGGMVARADLQGKMMIGVDWQMGQWLGTPAVSQFIPIAAGAPLNANCARVTAPKGYAVGAIKVFAPKYVASVQLIFMKINEDGSLDPSETKAGKWLGVKPKGEVTTLSGEGKRLIGLHYRKAVVIDAIGILVEP